MSWRDPDHLPMPYEHDSRAEDAAEAQAEFTIEQAAIDAFDRQPLSVTLTRAEASHLLALSLQFSLAERRDTVSRQINQTAMRKLDWVLA